jgi:hypothetical protein
MPAQRPEQATCGCQRKQKQKQTADASAKTENTKPATPAPKHLNPAAPRRGAKNPKTQKPKNHTNNIPTTTQKTTSTE